MKTLLASLLLLLSVQAQAASFKATVVDFFCGEMDPFVTEIFRPKNLPKEKCLSHKKVLVQSCHQRNDRQEVNISELTSLYFQWAQKIGLGSVDDQVRNACTREDYQIISDHKMKDDGFKIISPVSGSVYAIEPDIPRDLQQLNFHMKIPVNVSRVEWLINGKEIEGSEDLHQFKWKLKKGKHRFEAKAHYKDGEVEENEISIHVL